MGYIKFPVTNERPAAIAAGLDIKEVDRILAVCGAGDQALALLEKASYVLAADRIEEQVKHAQSRVEMLKQGDIEGFFAPARYLDKSEEGDAAHIKLYFSKEGRLGKIREKLARLDLRVADFTECLESAQFNKLYISNILGYDSFCMKSECCNLMRLLSGHLPAGGLVYIANNDDLERSMNYASAFIRLNEPDMWPKELVKDEELTRKAASLESSLWKPAVYRKTR